MEKIIGTVPGKCRKKREKARLTLNNNPEISWHMKKSRRTYNGVHLNKKSNTQDVVEQSLTQYFAVEKMRFAKVRDENGKLVADKTRIIYNSHITIENIPLKAYEYIVNGKSAIDWVMERYAVTIDKASQIKNDPNDWSREHEQPRYILDLLLSVIILSFKTVNTVDALPKLKI